MEKPTPDDTTRSMILYYRRATDQIVARLLYAKKDSNSWTKARQAQLLKQIAEILDHAEDMAGDHFKKALDTTVKLENQMALEDLQEFRDNLEKAGSWHKEYSQTYVNQVFTDTFQHIAGQTNRMKQTVKTNLRDDAKDVFRRASVEGIPRAKAHRLLRDKLVNRMPDFQFTDKAGRKWQTKTYLEMLTRTVMANTQREIYANTLTNEGHDLVKITQNGAWDDCRKWEGKILSLTGATKGYPTLQDATASGEIFHPNCKHRFVAYHKDIDDLFEKEAA